jgi:hypothetical protein
MSKSAVTSRDNRGMVGSGVFCWVCAEAVSGGSKLMSVSPSTESRENSRKSLQRGRPVMSENTVRQLLLVEAWEVEESPLSYVVAYQRRASCETVAGQ